MSCHKCKKIFRDTSKWKLVNLEKWDKSWSSHGCNNGFQVVQRTKLVPSFDSITVYEKRKR